MNKSVDKKILGDFYKSHGYDENGQRPPKNKSNLTLEKIIEMSREFAPKYYLVMSQKFMDHINKVQGVEMYKDGMWMGDYLIKESEYVMDNEAIKIPITDLKERRAWLRGSWDVCTRCGHHVVIPYDILNEDLVKLKCDSCRP